MAKDLATMEHSNPSGNASIHDVSDPGRRVVLRGRADTTLASLLGALPAVAASDTKLGFKAIPPGLGDKLVVPDGYVAQAIAAWGEPRPRSTTRGARWLACKPAPSAWLRRRA